MKTIGMIPARLESSRLHRKLLLSETGKPLIQYAWENASRAETLNEVCIATDSEEIAEAARGFGARVEMTRDHTSGSDRIAEVVRRAFPDADLIVNVQGDEPEVDPATIDRLTRSLMAHERVEMATLATPIHSVTTLEDRSCVKVVCAADRRALYFSRLPVPFSRDVPPEVLLDRRGEGAMYGESPWLLHLGLYAYRRPFLLAFTDMPPSRLERLESLEQLRALEAGASIHVEIVPHRSVGIDTADDYARFVERQKAG
jgi:3-deoxy-manno-octulosonate cytidylyltransferase (CMP-KDO synthetase)